MKNEVVLIGSVNLGGIADDGETMKNRMIIDVLKKYVDKVHVVDVRNKPNRVLYLLKFLFFLVFKRKCKIVVSASALVAYSMLKVISLFRYNKDKVYYWVIGGRFGEYVLRGEINKKYYKDIHTIIVEGDSMKDVLEASGLTNVITLRNFKDIQYIPIKSNSNESIFNFVFLSRVIPEKGVLYICRAVRILESMGINNFQVDFYGKIQPSFESEFQQEILTSTKLKYAGFLDLMNKKGVDKLAQYDVMLFPTYWPSEGFPGVIVDAFVAGLPVIASDWNLNKSIINDNIDGFIVPVHDVEALANKMKYVIEHKDVVKDISRNLQKKAMLYDTKNVVSYELLLNIGLVV